MEVRVEEERRGKADEEEEEEERNQSRTLRSSEAVARMLSCESYLMAKMTPS